MPGLERPDHVLVIPCLGQQVAISCTLARGMGAVSVYCIQGTRSLRLTAHRSTKTNGFQPYKKRKMKISKPKSENRIAYEVSVCRMDFEDNGDVLPLSVKRISTEDFA